MCTVHVNELGRVSRNSRARSCSTKQRQSAQHVCLGFVHTKANAKPKIFIYVILTDNQYKPDKGLFTPNGSESRKIKEQAKRSKIK